MSYSFILASRSPRRAKLLEQIGISFRTIPSEIDEKMENRMGVVAAKLSEQKANAVASMYPNSYVIGVDTLIIYKGQIVGKPNSYKEAKNLLKMFSDNWHYVVSGVSIINISKYLQYTFTETSSVKFKELNDMIIDNYLNLVYPLDKAGGYAIQEHADLIVEKVRGSVNNIIGFPTEKFVNILNLLLT